MTTRQGSAITMANSARKIRAGIGLGIACLACSHVQALTSDGSTGQPSSLFISVWNPVTQQSFYKDLGVNYLQFLSNPSLAVSLSGESGFGDFLGRDDLIYNIAGFQKLSIDQANLATWGFLLTSGMGRQGLPGDFVSIDAARQRMQIYASYLPGLSGIAKPGDGSYFEGENWGATLGGTVGSSTGLVGAETPFFRVNNSTGDPAGSHTELMGFWTLSNDGKLSFRREASRNQAPTAVIKPIAEAALGQPVILDGSASVDPDQAPESLRYSWTRVSGPIVSLSDGRAAKASFVASTVGAYTFRLTVGDGESSASTTVQLTVKEGGGGGSGQETIKLNASGTWRVKTAQMIPWVVSEAVPRQRLVKVYFSVDGNTFKLLGSRAAGKNALKWKPTVKQVTEQGVLRACIKPKGQKQWLCDDQSGVTVGLASVQ